MKDENASPENRTMRSGRSFTRGFLEVRSVAIHTSNGLCVVKAVKLERGKKADHPLRRRRDRLILTRLGVGGDVETAADTLQYATVA